MGLKTDIAVFPASYKAAYINNFVLPVDGSSICKQA